MALIFLNTYLIVLLLGGALFFGTSCTLRLPRNEKSSETEFSKAFPLAVGNYWIYQTAVIYPNKMKQVGAQLDSVWIEKDTMVNGKRYFVQLRATTGPLPTLLTDSAGFIISQVARFKTVCFSRNSATDTLFSQAPYYRVMITGSQKTKVPAGTFNTVNSIQLLQITPQTQLQAAEFPPYNAKYLIQEQCLYANKVGLVKRISYYAGNRIEESLVKYAVSKSN